MSNCFFYLIIILHFLTQELNAYNKIVNKNFDWQIYSTDYFDIYYYDEGKNILSTLTDILDNVYTSDTEDLNYEPPSKTTLFLYIGDNDFQQTNITDIFEGTGGITEAYKYRVVIPHLGSKLWLQHVLRHEFTHVIQFNVLFNGFWKSARLIKFPFYPLWLMEGMAEYETKNLDKTTKEMYLRDALIPVKSQQYRTSNKLLPIEHLNNFNHLKPHQIVLAYKESNAFIEFISDEFGEDKIHKILFSYRDKFDADNILKETIGLNLSEAYKKFVEYLEDKYEIIKDTLKEPEEYGIKLTESSYYYTFNTNPILTSDKKNIIYISDRKGFNEILLYNIETKKIKTLIGKNFYDYLEGIKVKNKCLAKTSDDRYLFFIGKSQQKDFIYKYDFKKNKLEKIYSGVEIIDSIDLLENQKKIIFIGLFAGYNNIFTVNFDGKNLSKLTNFFDDISDIAISKDEKVAVFSKEEKVENSDKIYERNLWCMNLENNQLQQLTNLNNDEYNPVVSSDNKLIFFISDMDDINNLYVLERESNTIKKLTSIIGGISNPYISSDGEKLLFSCFRNGEQHIYIQNTNIILKNNENQIVKNEISNNNHNKNEIMTNLDSQIKPYRFNVSTDLLFPIFYYSTTDGLYIAFYWQLSDITGDHQLNFYTQYLSGYKYLDYNISYSFLKIRPKIFLSFSGTGDYIDFYRTQYYLSQNQTIGINYPLSRYSSGEFSISNSIYLLQTTDLNTGALIEKKVNTIYPYSISFLRDTVTGKYLEPTSGYNLSLNFQSVLNSSNIDYQVYSFTLSNYFNIYSENILANRSLIMSSSGRDKYNFQLYGYDRLRIKPDNNTEWTGCNLLLNNLEFRIPILKDINYHMWYFFPDFFFKTLYCIIFSDLGIVWNDYNQLKQENIKYSYGLGFKVYTFILEIYPMSINLLYSYSPLNKQSEWYFLFGNVF